MTTETGIYEYAKQGLALSADKPAIWFYGKSITYRELFEKIDNVADNLYAMGVREGTVVTIHLPNCPQAVMAIYAVAKLGGICNMVHALIPAKGLKEDMDFAESSFLITYKADCAKTAEKAIAVDISYHMGALFRTALRLKNGRIKTDCRRFEELEEPCSKKAAVPNSESLAEKCVVYFRSSGTTDVPKTVMHCHRAINNWVANAQNFFHTNSMEGEVFMQVLPSFHGSGFVLDMHQFLTGGATLVTLAQWNAKQAVRFIKKYGVTMMTGVPRVYQDLLKNPAFRGGKIHQCYVSGDYVGAALKKAFNERVGRDSCLYEGYGMTEIVTACYSCGPEHENINASGYPLSNCRIAVLTPEGSVKNRGTGELIVLTNTMMMGYLKDKAATDAVKLDFDGEIWFRTGDMGSIDEEGFVYYIERVKNTIIHNGYNVYPAEVEKAIRTVKGVEDVCAVGILDKNKNTQHICAYVISDHTDDENLERRIMSACSESLPRYAIPREIRLLDSFPRNRMAKVDRKKLEQME